MAQEIGDQGAEHSGRRRAELGRLLAAADGYQVVTSDGTHLARLDHVRYMRYADHPDEIVVRRRAVFPRRRPALPFSAVETVMHRASQPDPLFRRGEEMSIPAPWLVAQQPPSIQRT